MWCGARKCKGKIKGGGKFKVSYSSEKVRAKNTSGDFYGEGTFCHLRNISPGDWPFAFFWSRFFASLQYLYVRPHPKPYIPYFCASEDPRA